MQQQRERAQAGIQSSTVGLSPRPCAPYFKLYQRVNLLRTGADIDADASIFTSTSPLSSPIPTSELQLPSSPPRVVTRRSSPLTPPPPSSALEPPSSTFTIRARPVDDGEVGEGNGAYLGREGSVDSVLGWGSSEDRNEPAADAAGDDGAALPRPGRTRGGWEFLTPAESRCIERIEKILRLQRWSIGQFLSAWIRHGRNERRVGQLRDALKSPVFQPALPGALSDDALLEVVSGRVRREWRSVVGCGMFRKELPNVTVEELDYGAVIEFLKRCAPLWVGLLVLLLRPQRPIVGGAAGVSDAIVQRIVIITIVCFGVFARETTAGVRLLLGCFLQNAGLARRGMEVLAGFGLVPTYKYVVREVTAMAERAKVVFVRVLLLIVC